jgi:hypothetical protein
MELSVAERDTTLLDALDQIEVPDLDRVEPLPILLPPFPQAES